MVRNLIMSAKIATLAFFIVSVYDFTNEILLRESIYIVDVVM